MEIKTEMQQVVETITHLENEVSRLNCELTHIKGLMRETSRHLQDASNSIDADAF